MDPSHLDDHYRSSLEMSSDSSVSSDCSDTSDIFDDPLVQPRVGDEYQVEIPPLLSESELVQLKINPANSEAISAAPHSYLMGLPIPVTWVDNHAKSSVKSESFEPENTTGMDQDSNLTSLSNEYSAVPGMPTETWSDFEADCFLLGLYIFGKDLLQVQRFMESKDMGQILLYYYGPFCGSAGYLKWKERRKIKNKKCIVGYRFLSGHRQQELFSRLLPHLNEESKTTSLEASRAFAEGSTSLVEYISTLKALVGVRALVEAAAIGKGKQDLTTLVTDSKSSQTLPNRSDIPSAKAISSLTCAQIVKYLTGQIRLSKTRSNDLFWEAVWPRLLARGWHSEQPRMDVYAGSKNGLVFLIPGVKKFSRRKLIKGDHYFDSVTDVLAKVASEPELLELEGDETKPNVEMNSGDDHDQESSDHEHYRYLKPCVSPSSSGFPDGINKFTVVDTSLASESNPLKTREIRSLPLGARRSSKKFETGNSNIHQFRMKLGQSNCSVPLTKRRRRGSGLGANVSYVLSLPAQVKNATTSKKAVSSRTSAGVKEKKVVEGKTNGKIECSFPEDATIRELKKLFDLNLPHVATETDDQTHTTTQQHCNAENPTQSDADIVSTSETKDALPSSSAVGPTNGPDQQPRRQSTRSRPLTTKALEALEVSFLSPVRHSRKRSSSTQQDQKQSKRSQQQRGKSCMFPDVIGFQDGPCNANTDALAKPPIGTMSLPTELS